MKYSAEQIRNLSILEWTSLMAEELNEKGFCKRDYDFKTGRISRPYQGRKSLRGFLFDEVNSWDEIDYLREIGLINNGRCSLCGKPLKRKPKIYNKPNGLHLQFEVCNRCEGGHKKKSDSWLTVLVVLVTLSFIVYLMLK